MLYIGWICHADLTQTLSNGGQALLDQRQLYIIEVLLITKHDGSYIGAVIAVDILPSLTRGDSYGCRVLHQTGLPLCSFSGFLLSTKLKLYQTSPWGVKHVRAVLTTSAFWPSLNWLQAIWACPALHVFLPHLLMRQDHDF